MPKTGFDPQFVSLITKQRGIAVSLQSVRTVITENFENSSSELWKPKKAENLGKKFAKN